MIQLQINITARSNLFKAHTGKMIDATHPANKEEQEIADEIEKLIMPLLIQERDKREVKLHGRHNDK